MKLRDLLFVLKNNPEILIYFYPHGYESRGSAIFRGPLTQLPYVRVEKFLNHDVEEIIHTEDYLQITLKI